MTRWMVGVCAVLVGGCMTGSSSIGEPVEADGGGSTSGGAVQGSTDGVSATSSQQMDDDSSSGSGAVDGDDTGSTTAGPQLACPEFSQCSFALDCDEESFFQCGDLLSRADVDGCPRPFCDSDEECPEGYRCVLPRGWGKCSPNPCNDNPDDGTCECPFVGLICESKGSCVSEDTFPPPEPTGHDYCALHTDEESCNAVPPIALSPIDERRCRWYEGFEMDFGESCSERVPTARCVYTHESKGIEACENDDALRPVAGVDVAQPDRVTVLLIDDEYEPLYVGGVEEWVHCGWIDSAECDCACP